MKKMNAMNLIEGGIIGAVLGVAAGIVLAPKSGKEFRDDVSKKSAEFHAYLAPHFKKMKKVGEVEYGSFVKEAVKTYAKAKKLSEKEATDLVSHAKKSWKHIKRASA